MGCTRPPYYFTAYGLAVKHGFQGTEQEWLESLKGDKVQLRYQDGILQWKWVTGSDDQWQDLIDLSQVQGWSDQAQHFALVAAGYCQDSERAAQEVQESTEELYQKAEALTKSVSTRMVVDFEAGSINTGDGADADGSAYADRIRSGYFPNLSGKIGVTAPSTVKSRLVFYNADLSFHSSAGAFTAGSYQVGSDAAFARLIVGYVDDSDVGDVDALASTVAVYMPVELPEQSQPLTVTITGNDTDGYTADKRIDDIQAADEAGQDCVCLWDGLRLPLVLWEDATAHFAAVVDGLEYRVEIGQETVTAVCEGLGREIFEVTVSGNDTDGYTASKTLAEVLTVHNDRCVRCMFDDHQLPLVYVDGAQVCFSAILEDGKTFSFVVIGADGVTAGSTELAQKAMDVAVTAAEDGTLTADKTFVELWAAYQKQVPVRCLYDGYVLYPTVCNATLMTFSASAGTGYRLVHYSASGAVTASAGTTVDAEDAKVRYVTMTADDTGTYTADKTFAEVMELHEAGYTVCCKITYGGFPFVLPVCVADSSYLMFGGATMGTTICVTFTSNEKVDVLLEGLVPTSRTINGHALAEDVTLTAEDVGAPQRLPIKWIALGDGITQGYYSYLDDTETPVTMLDPEKGWAALVAKYNGWELTSLASAGSGYVQTDTQGTDMNLRDLVDVTDFSGADLITLFFGVHDWLGDYSIGTMNDGKDAGTLYGNMRYCISQIFAKNPTAKIIVISPINCSLYGSPTAKYAIGYQLPTSGTLEDVFKAEQEVCNYYGVEFIDMLHGSALSWANIYLSDGQLLADGIHPTQAGHRLLAMELSRKIMGVNPTHQIPEDPDDFYQDVSTELVTGLTLRTVRKGNVVTLWLSGIIESMTAGTPISEALAIPGWATPTTGFSFSNTGFYNGIFANFVMNVGANGTIVYVSDTTISNHRVSVTGTYQLI